MRSAEEIGVIIERICDKKGIPLLKLSEILSMDVSDVIYFLKGRRLLSFDQFKKIADFLEISVKDLLQEDPKKLGIDTKGIPIKSKIRRFINGFRYIKFRHHK